MIEALSSNPFALSLSKGLFADVDLFAELLTIGRGLPGSKLLSFVSPKESDQRKSDPAHPRNPENRARRMGGKELAPLYAVLNWFFVSDAQTPLPLIHPAGSIFGGAERGGKPEPGR